MMLLLCLLAALEIPRLAVPVAVDGNLAEWKERAFHDGV